MLEEVVVDVLQRDIQVLTDFRFRSDQLDTRLDIFGDVLDRGETAPGANLLDVVRLVDLRFQHPVAVALGERFDALVV